VKREPGWYKDPYFRSQERYWDGEVWSQRTRQPAGGTVSDSPVDATGPADPASAPVDTDAATAMLGSSAPLHRTQETPVTPAKGTGSTQKSAPTATSVSRSASAPQAPQAPHTVLLGATTTSGSPTARPGQGAQRRRRGLLITVVAVLVVLFVVAGVYLTRGGGGAGGASGGGSGGSGATASQSGVAAAVQKTLHKGTADAVVDVKVSTGTRTASQEILSGTGAYDLKNQAGTMSLTVPGTTATNPATQIVFIGPAVYVNLGTKLSSLIPGKTWVTGTTAQLGSSGSDISPGISSFEQLLGNPATLVQQLDTSAARFTSLGTTTFDGAQVQHYQVTFSPAQQTTTTGLAGSSTGATSGTHSGEVLYVSSKGLVEAVVIPVVVSANGQSFHESITIAFSKYGHPVTVLPPPAQQIATLDQYVAAAGQSGPGSDPGGPVPGPGPAPLPTN
jgi:hypothetical protein